MSSIAFHERPSTGPAAVFAEDLQSRLPVIETERLRLRAPRIEDFDAYAEIATGERGIHILEDQTREAAWLDFTQMVATWMLRGHGLWTVETRADTALAGFVLLGFEPGDHEPELGYMFLQAAEGKGYAFEAAEAARRYGTETLALPSLVSTIDPENTRSIRLAERLGGHRDPQAEAAHANKIIVYRYLSTKAS